MLFLLFSAVKIQVSLHPTRIASKKQGNNAFRLGVYSK